MRILLLHCKLIAREQLLAQTLLLMKGLFIFVLHLLLLVLEELCLLLLIFDLVLEGRDLLSDFG
jgi:hypothetical protein